MISTHILDTGSGLPAAQVRVLLEKRDGDGWTRLDEALTNHDGRISFACPAVAGAYRLTFEVEAYFRRLGRDSFFLSTPVSFEIKDTTRKYHVPLLLNSYGYSTYRGS